MYEKSKEFLGCKRKMRKVQGMCVSHTLSLTSYDNYTYYNPIRSLLFLIRDEFLSFNHLLESISCNFFWARLASTLICWHGNGNIIA